MYEHRSAGMFSDRETSFFDTKARVIKSLKPAALQEFQKLDRTSQEALLDFSEDIAKNQLASEKSSASAKGFSRTGLLRDKASKKGTDFSEIAKNRARTRGGSLAKSKQFTRLQAKALTNLLTESGATGSNTEASTDATKAGLRNSASTSLTAARTLTNTAMKTVKASGSVASFISKGKAKKARTAAKAHSIKRMKKARTASKYSSKAAKKIAKVSKNAAKKAIQALGTMFSTIHKPLIILFIIALVLLKGEIQRDLVPLDDY